MRVNKGIQVFRVFRVKVVLELNALVTASLHPTQNPI